MIQIITAIHFLMQEKWKTSMYVCHNSCLTIALLAQTATSHFLCYPGSDVGNFKPQADSFRLSTLSWVRHWRDLTIVKH